MLDVMGRQKHGLMPLGLWKLTGRVSDDTWVNPRQGGCFESFQRGLFEKARGWQERRDRHRVRGVPRVRCEAGLREAALQLREVTGSHRCSTVPLRWGTQVPGDTHSNKAACSHRGPGQFPEGT